MFWIVPGAILGLCVVAAVLADWRDRRRGRGTYRRTSADHGEAFGEWGQYGHPNASPLPVVKKVPWVETTASDTNTHTPAEESQGATTDVKEHLADLGYRT